eukprot:4245792-Pleurochrysis_carterae.AAC.5
MASARWLAPSRQLAPTRRRALAGYLVPARRPVLACLIAPRLRYALPHQDFHVYCLTCVCLFALTRALAIALWHACTR